MADTTHYCPVCGTPNDTDNLFCDNCGTDLSALVKSVQAANSPGMQAANSPDAQASASVVAEGSAAYSVGGAHAAAPKRGKKRIGLIVGIVAAVIAVIAIVSVAIVMQQKAEYERQHQLYSVPVNVKAQGYFVESASPIPMLLEGTDFEGNLVSERFLYSGQADPVQAMRGEYTVSILSSPITDKGTIFQIPTASKTIVIEGDVEVRSSSSSSAGSSGSDSSGGSAGSGSDASSGSSAAMNTTSGSQEPGTGTTGGADFEMQPIEPLQMTDEMIKAAYDGLVEAGYPAEEAKTFQEAAVKCHQDAVAAREAEIAAQKAAERAAQKAEFQRKLNLLNSDQFEQVTGPLDRRNAGSTVQLGTQLKGIQDLGSEVLQYLGTVLSPDEYAALQGEYSSFESATSSESDAEMKRMYPQGGGNGMYLTGLSYEIHKWVPFVQSLIDRIP